MNVTGYAKLLEYPAIYTNFLSRTNLPAGGGQPFRLSPPPDSPLCRLPIAHKLFWSFFLITAPALNRLHRFRSRLTARLPVARAEFLQRVRRLLTGGSLRPACALGGNRLASLFQDEVLQQPLFFVSTKKEPVPQRGGSTSRSDVRERSEGNPNAGLSSGASAEEEAIFIACNKNGDKRRNRGLLQKQSFCNSLVVIPKILIQS